MAKTKTETTEEVTETQPEPAPEPEKITTVEDLGIGAADPYPTAAEGEAQQ